MPPAASPPPSDESALSYPGWRVVAACFLMALFCWGFGLYGHAVYLAELQRLHGWPASLISGASTASYLFNAVLVVFTADLIARLGPRRFVLGGLVALAIATALVAVVDRPWQLYAAYLTMSFGWVGLGTVTISTLLSRWFDRRRGLAISLALNGASSGGVVVVPALVALTGAFGFTRAMLLATAAMLVVLVPVVLLWIAPPAGRMAAEPAHARAPALQAAVPTRGQMLASWRFWSIAAPYALALAAQIAFIVHQIALVEPTAGRAVAAFSVSVMTAMAVVGRLTLGIVIDRLEPRLATAGSLVSQAVALGVMASTSDPTVLVLSCAAYGFSVGNIITLPGLIIGREFAPAAFGAVLGLSTAVGTFVGAFGPGLVGLVREASGSYAAALALCLAFKLIAAGLVLAGRGRAGDQ